MELAKDTNIQTAISEGLKRAITYSQYRSEVAHFAATNDTSGPDKSEFLADYTKLNDSRMKRWDKTIRISDEIKAKIAKFDKSVTWLVLTESWCGDAAHIVPVINKIAELSQYIDLKLVYRDENQSLMNCFLTNGSQSIPKLIMIDNHSGNVLDTFGPRPNEAIKLVSDFKSKHGALTPEFKEELQLWYNKDKGQSTVQDLLKLLNL